MFPIRLWSQGADNQGIIGQSAVEGAFRGHLVQPHAVTHSISHHTEGSTGMGMLGEGSSPVHSCTQLCSRCRGRARNLCSPGASPGGLRVNPGFKTMGGKEAIGKQRAEHPPTTQGFRAINRREKDQNSPQCGPGEEAGLLWGQGVALPPHPEAMSHGEGDDLQCSTGQYPAAGAMGGL